MIPLTAHRTETKATPGNGRRKDSMTSNNTLVQSVSTHHTNGHVPVRAGMTLREALISIRAHREKFGSIGGMMAELSDGSHLSVECRCQSMGSQRIERRFYDSYASTDKLLRVYPW
jgi:hypothetical protein